MKGKTITMKQNMNKVKVITLLCSLTLLLPLSGCGTMSKQKTAIMEAIASYNDAHIEVDDLQGQLRGLTQETTGYEDKASYTLDVKIPNYALVDINALDYEVPSVDYANPDSDAYLEDLLIAIRQSIDVEALMKEPDGTVPAQITVNLSLVEKTWEANISAASMRTIQAEADKMMRNKLSNPKNLPPEYSFVRVAEQKNELFETLISGSDYIEAIAVTGVEALGNNEYRLNVSYPDPEATFQALGERYSNSFSELVFGGVTCTLDPDDFSSIVKKPSMKTGSITVGMTSDGNCTVVDGEAFAEAFNNARMLTEAATTLSVNEKWGVLEQERPTENTLLYTRGSGDSEFSFCLSGDATGSYIRLYSVENSAEEAGILQAGAYLLPNNKTMYISLPPGTYKMVVAWGSTWYGPEYMFGPSGNYLFYEKAVTVKSGRSTGYTVKYRWSQYKDFDYSDYVTNPTE